MFMSTLRPPRSADNSIYHPRQPNQPWRVLWLKLHQHVQVAVRAKILAQCRAKHRQLADVMATAEVGDLLLRKLDPDVVLLHRSFTSPLEKSYFLLVVWLNSSLTLTLSQQEKKLQAPNPKSAILNPKLLDHFVRPHEHVGRDRQADLLGRLEIDP